MIAATHVNLEEKVESGEFREDLFYRLNQIPLFNSLPKRAFRRHCPLGHLFYGQALWERKEKTHV